MRKKAPERQLQPPDTPEPFGQCWSCNEDIYPDTFNTVFYLGNYFCCGRKECIEAIGIEEELEDKYKKFKKKIDDNDFMFYEFVKGELMRCERVPTDEDLEMMEAERKMEEKWSEEEKYRENFQQRTHNL